MAERAYAAYVPMIETMHRPVWLSDATLLTGFDPTALALGARWFVAFKHQGGSHCFIASRWERSMMAARTMALGLGIRMRAFSSLAEAKAHADRVIAEDR
jgi:hypothetical protein